MVGGTWIESPHPIPPKYDWLTNKSWCSLCELAKNTAGFETLVDDFKTYNKEFTQIYNSIDPFS